MRSRLRGLGVPAVQARTFHSAALRQLRFFWDRFAEGDFPRIIENKAGIIGSVMQSLGLGDQPGADPRRRLGDRIRRCLAARRRRLCDEGGGA